MEDGYDTIKAVEDKKEGITLASDYYIQPFTTKKIVGTDWHKFIDSTKLMVRTSDEYREYIAHVKTFNNLKNCAFLGNVDDCEGEVDIEIHHTPLTIHEVIEIIATDMLFEKKSITTFDVAQRVMEEHFRNMIGIVPVSKTIHELIHDGKINVSINQVFGDVSGFLKKYARSVLPETSRKVEAFIKIADEVGTLPDKELLSVDEKVFHNPASNKLSYQGVAKLLTKKEKSEESKENED